MYLPADSALLVIDMQRYFVDEKSHAFIPSAAAIIPGLLRLIDKYRERNRPVFFTRHLNDNPDTGVMDKWWGELINSDDPLSVIDERFPAKDDEVIEKTQYEAFHNTDLEGRLRNHNVSQVVVCGVMTHLCCESTARAAFMRGYEVFFPVDGTATYNEDFHRATLLNLSHGFAEMVLVDELIKACD
jgi:isochorismate hydrolase